MSKIVIVGLDHFLQNIGPVCSTAGGRQSEETQKRAFTEFLETVIAAERIELIAEEAKLDGKSLGSVLARTHQCEHVNITMPLAERAARNIGADYEDNPESKRSAYRQFEEYMFCQIIGLDALAILVMCGRCHASPLGDMLKRAGHDVRTYDVKGLDWYKGRPMETVEGEFTGHHFG